MRLPAKTWALLVQAVDMTSTVDCLVVWGARAGVGPGFTLEAAAVRLAADIGELRNDGGIPSHVRTVITVLPQEHVLEIRVEGPVFRGRPGPHHDPRSDQHSL
jgi:hypothetical protein